MSLIAENVSLHANGEIRLCEISCEIRPGELTVIIGPNGSGKTSLIKTLAGELIPTQGHLSLDGLDLREWKAGELAQRRAVMPQHATLDFPFRVSDVVALGRSPYPRDLQKDQNLVEEAMACFDVKALADRMYTSLSGGERQRVQLARVWVQLRQPEGALPRYLLLDEPSSALDLRHQRELLALLKNSVHSGQFGVATALHDLNSAAQYADQLILLNKGFIAASGSREQVFTTENITNIYKVPVEFLGYTAGKKQVIAVPDIGVTDD
ncbi:MAG: heme ABC transporter ATP-binding protein [Proteobacteria bacterium]|nr:heme ABC transporter ATP-binding protein [Pseudomonadota bacterium]